MFSKRRGPSQLDLVIDKTIRQLNLHQIGSAEYKTILDSLVQLHKLKVEEKPSFVSKDTLVVVGGNLLGILMIIQHERVNVVTSRAISLLLKPR